MAERPADLIAALRAELGAAAVRDGEAVWRLSAAGAAPLCVVEPEDVDGVAAAVGAVARHGVALLPVGNGTHLGIGWPPRATDGGAEHAPPARSRWRTTPAT